MGDREAAVAAIAANNLKFAENNAKRMKLLRSQENYSDDNDDDNDDENDDDNDDDNDDENDNGKDVGLQNLNPIVTVNCGNGNKDANKIDNLSQQKEKGTENGSGNGNGKGIQNEIKNIKDSLMASIKRDMLAQETASRKRELAARDKSKTDK